MPHARRSTLLVIIGLLLALSACTTSGPALEIGIIADRSTVLGEPLTVSVSVTGAASAAISVSATSSDQNVVPNAGLTASGAGTPFTLTITPSATTTGSATITVTATAGGKSATRAFDVTVAQPFAGPGTELKGLNSEVVGASVAVSSDYLVTGGDEYAYVFWRVGDQWQPMAKLIASDAGAGQGFGGSVAVSGDVIVVGSDTHGGGAAYVFERVGNAWTEVKKLVDPVAAISDSFGRSVAIDGGYIVVGAQNDEYDSVKSGSAFVFTKQDVGGWSLYGKLGPTDPVADDVFGEDVDIDGEYLIVGNYGGNTNGDEAGQATIFRLEASVWAEDDELDPVELEAGDQFGTTVAISGQYALVGAGNDDEAGNDAGAAYVFHRAAGGWSQVDKLLPPNPAPFESFGNSVALDYPYAVIGAYNDDDPVSRAGSAYVFRHDGTEWHLVAELDAPTPTADLHFGYRVDVAGEYLAATTGDGPKLVTFQR